MARIRRILFASDFSQASAKAFGTVASLAKATGARVTILHVVVPYVPAMPDQFIDGETLDQLNTQARRWADRQLARLTKRAAKAGIQAASLRAEGDAAVEIVRASRATRAELVVVGTHGRTGLNRFLVGSVAARVLASAPCPVVTVRSATRG